LTLGQFCGRSECELPILISNQYAPSLSMPICQYWLSIQYEINAIPGGQMLAFLLIIMYMYVYQMVNVPSMRILDSHWILAARSVAIRLFLVAS